MGMLTQTEMQYCYQCIQQQPQVFLASGEPGTLLLLLAASVADLYPRPMSVRQTNSNTSSRLLEDMKNLVLFATLVLGFVRKIKL